MKRLAIIPAAALFCACRTRKQTQTTVALQRVEATHAATAAQCLRWLTDSETVTAIHPEITVVTPDSTVITMRAASMSRSASHRTVNKAVAVETVADTAATTVAASEATHSQSAPQAGISAIPVLLCALTIAAGFLLYRLKRNKTT